MNEKSKIKIEAMLSWFLLPVYIWQGLAIRRKLPRFAPPHYPGTCHYQPSGTSDHPPLQILVLGDSSAAGTGVKDFADSFGGNLLDLLSKQEEMPVSLTVSGSNSATCAQVRDYVVPHLEPLAYDYIFLNIGTNDAKNLHTGMAFKRDFGTLLYALKARFPSAKIVWSGILDLEQLPSLPSPLNWILGARSRLCLQIGKQLCRERGAHSPTYDWAIIDENFSHDGFHASEIGYRRWAQCAAMEVDQLSKFGNSED